MGRVVAVAEVVVVLTFQPSAAFFSTSLLPPPVHISPFLRLQLQPESIKPSSFICLAAALG